MMKSFFKKLAFVMALAMVVSLAAPAATTAAAADAIQIKYQNGVDTPSEINLTKVGATEDLKFTGAPDYKEAGFEWTSSNPAVATVDQTGLVTAVAAGTAEVTVKVGTDREDTVKVNVVDLPTYTATMGTSSKDLKTEVALEVGDEIDFGFFGIKDYDRNRYQCNWFEAGNGSVATVDKNGVIKAIGEGTTVISLGVYNVVTGMKHSVASCTVTVGAKATPVPDKGIVATQTTENDMYITFTGIDATSLKKANIEVYESYTTEELVQEYAWQIYEIKVDEDDKDVLNVYGYSTSEFIDGCTYVVRVVDNNGNVVAEDDFVASVGAVTKVTASYASYLNNQGDWYFANKAYTNASSGEEVTTKIFYKVWDANGIDVTGHFKALNDNEDIVTIEVVTEEADPYLTIDEDTNVLLFSDIPETRAVSFNVIYEDYENDNEVSTPLTMVVEEAPAYGIKSVDDWTITITSGDNSHKTGWDYMTKTVALYDDYDLATGTELMNHEIVLWFTDNYGNKYVTNETFEQEWNDIYYIDHSEKFYGEGYEIHYETRNPQVLVVGDSYVVGSTTNSSVITTEKVGTAKVNVTLYNAFEDELIGRTEVLSIDVKPARYVKSIETSNVTVTTDSLPYNGAGYVDTAETDPNNDGNDSLYDTDLTGATIKFVVKDQYGVEWGLYNKTAAASIDVSATATNVDIQNLNYTWGTASESSATYKQSINGAAIVDELTTAGEKESSLTYKVVVVDALNDYAEKTATFRVSLKTPTLDKDGNIVTKNVLKVDATDVSYTSDADYAAGMNAYITVTELSSNGLKVNYAEDRVNNQPIQLITSNDEYNALFSSSKNVASTKEALYLAVFDPKGKVVGLLDDATDDELGLVELQSGSYRFQYADTKSGDLCTRFATAGTYTVKLMEVTSVKAGNLVNTFTTTTQKFTITNDLLDAAVVNQKAIYLNSTQADDIVEIAKAAFKYNVSFDGKPYVDITDVRFRLNSRANAVVIQDVIMKVNINENNNWNLLDDDAWYYIEVPVDMTVSLEDISQAAGTSVQYGKDPEGEKLQ